MADSDSFINEVSEEVRRDRLFAFFRKWAWAFAAVVILIVGAAAYAEFRRGQTERAAQDFGDAVLAALDTGETADRIAALAAIETVNPEAEMLLTLLIAGQESDAGRDEDAAARLLAIVDRDDMPERYRDLAFLKAHMLAPGDRAEAMATLDRLARPGAPYRGLALEQQAYLMIADGDLDAGRVLLEELFSQADASPGLRQRALELMIALDSGATLTDAPLPEPASDSVTPTLPPALDLPTGTVDAPDQEDAPADE
ncbi:MAG: hypothetical protein AAGC82_05945 [Pseudomonadota bacterium]